MVENSQILTSFSGFLFCLFADRLYDQPGNRCRFSVGVDEPVLLLIRKSFSQCAILLNIGNQFIHTDTHIFMTISGCIRFITVAKH